MGNCVLAWWSCFALSAAGARRILSSCLNVCVCVCVRERERERERGREREGGERENMSLCVCGCIWHTHGMRAVENGQRKGEREGGREVGRETWRERVRARAYTMLLMEAYVINGGICQ